jgi:hypothetical protein
MTARRHLLAGLAALALAQPALIATAWAADRTVTPPLKKLFPYLDGYLSLPPQERSLFRVVYKLMLDGKPSPLIRLKIEGAPVPIGPDGRIGRLPGLAALKSDQKAELSGPEGDKMNLALDVEPIVAPAAEMDAHLLAAASQQATAGAKKAAGVLGFAAPRLDRVVFEGAAGGQAINAQGKATALAVVKGNPVFDPAKLPDARVIRFSRAPRRLVLDKAG